MTTRPLSVLAAAAEVQGRAALLFDDRVLTYAELADAVARTAGSLAALRLPRGANVALRATSRPETVVAILALIELGIPFVPIHPRLRPAEVEVLLDDAQPARTFDDDALDDLAHGEPIARIPALSEDDAPLAILYTSGSTGRPKGAVLTRSAFLASARASEGNLGWRDDDRWLLCMPLCHTGGLSILTRCLSARRTVVLERAFQPGAIVDAIERTSTTLLSVVPTMLEALLAADRRGALARTRAILVGGAAAPIRLMQACADRQLRAITSYGLTETCSQIIAQSPAEALPRARPGSGKPLAEVELAIVNERGERLGAGEAGRIRVRGPMLMRGYLGREPLAPGAWFETGDLGETNEQGELFVHARRTDLIVTGGENVYPVEVEQAIEGCGGVARALVFGVPDETWGQRVAAAIVLDRTRPADTGALREALVARLAPHKLPRLVCFPAELPVVTADKLDRAGAVARLEAMLRGW